MIDYNKIDAYELASTFENWLDSEHPSGQNHIQISRDLIQFIEDQQSN